MQASATPAGKSSSKSRKTVKESTKEPKQKSAAAPKQAAPKVAAKRKLQVDTSSSTSGLPIAPTKTKLGAPKPYVKKEFVKYVKHEKKEVPITLVCNLLNYKDGRASLEVDEDAKDYLNAIGNGFSTHVDFKTPVRVGDGKNAGRIFVSAKPNSEQMDDSYVNQFLSTRVEVKGKAVTYGFNNDEGERVDGWRIVLDEIDNPAQTPTGTSDEPNSAGEDEDDQE